MTFSHLVSVEELLRDDTEFRALNNANRLLTFTRTVEADNDLKPACKWDSRYYSAAKVHLVERLDPNALILADFWACQELSKHDLLFEATREQILDDEVPNPGIYLSFFSLLRELIAAGSRETWDSDASDGPTQGTRDEHRADKPAETALLIFLDLWNSLDICGPDRFEIDETMMESVVRCERFKGSLSIQGALVKYETDGHGVITHAYRGGRKRASTTVVFGIEAKRHLHLRRKGNDVAIAAQVAAEAIAIAQRNEEKKSRGTPEVFIFFIHHRRCYIVSAVFSTNYLSNLEGAGLGAEDYLVLKKTKEFDLAKGDHRKKVAKCVAALFRYLKSGHARMGVLDFEARGRSVVGNNETLQAEQSDCPKSLSNH
ncbi:hypothetical protein SpCBS45565_g07842 [Spizellomyces sp. 'palustris']|nr:hypothetical protein SpCBS45565_g07842 [Spizellomyces sp. 'palustris']